jgi:hypothetical protein
MSRWEFERDRRRQKRNALLLLAVAGAVRPVDIVIRYRGTELERGRTRATCNPPWLWRFAGPLGTLTLGTYGKCIGMEQLLNASQDSCVTSLMQVRECASDKCHPV